MNSLKLKIFIFIIFQLFFTTSLSNASTKVPFDNIIINEKPINYKEIIFEDFSGNIINLKNFRDSVFVLNFWTTWCAPCKKEMPSLDALYQNNAFKNLQVFAVNMEQPNISKTKKFFSDLDIKKLEIFFDPKLNFVKEFKLRGVPTTVLINKKGEEFARIIGEINFNDKKFVKWLLKYD